jgi:stage II sporulation protein Q
LIIVYNHQNALRLIAEVMKMREEEKKRTSQSSFKRFSQKRWVFPAIYIASAAIILTAVIWYTNTSSDVAEDDYKATDIAGKNNPPAVEVNKPLENIVMPVPAASKDAVVIQKKFYDVNASAEEQEAALVSYGNTFQPNTGLDIAMTNGEAFEVVAALSGTVTKVQEDSLLGNVIEVEHDNNVVTRYQSLTDIAVEVGTQVAQGQVIAKAGQSLLNEEAGVHVHFEIRKDGTPVNPSSYFDKPVSAVQVEVEEEEVSADESKVEDKSTTEESVTEEEATTEESTKEEGTSTEDPASKKDDQGGATGSDEDKDNKGDAEQPKEDSTKKESNNS